MALKPDGPSVRIRGLMAQAALLRAAGVTWADVGALLGRGPHYCLTWAKAYPRVWAPLLRQARATLLTAEGAAAFRHLRAVLNGSPDEGTQVTAGAMLFLAHFPTDPHDDYWRDDAGG